MFDPNYDDSAKSNLDMVAEYTDTLDDNSWVYAEWDGRPHIPLNLKITQRSYSWGSEYAQDFVLIDYSIQNMGTISLEDAFVGILVTPMVFHESKRNGGQFENICGFKRSHPSKVSRGYLDTVDLAWSSDNDGDPGDDGVYGFTSVTCATGLRVLQKPAGNLRLSFNWYTRIGQADFSWGPMLESNARTFMTGGRGYAADDREMYYIMSNGEVDYDQVFADVDLTAQEWLPPSPAISSSIARGEISTSYIVSAGPFDIPAGESVPLTIAYLGGEDFHRVPDAFRSHMESRYDPEEFYRTLGFDDLAENAVRAYWVYDNPGYDTDGDGYSGPYWEIPDTLPDGEIVLERHYYAGDGVPDFRAASPPPAPVIRVSTGYKVVRLAWNGMVSETAVDPFTGIVDFEGYRVYMGRLDRIDDLALVASHDFCDFSQYAWNEERGLWQKIGSPMTLDSLRSVYGEDFDPAEYPCGSSGTGLDDDSVTYCFKPADWNQTIEGWNDGGIPGKQEFRKKHADEIADGLVTPEIDIEDTLISNNWVKDLNPLTGDSMYYHKYYEYEFVIENLLPSVPWYFSVTAFDFGDAFHDIEPLESSPMANMVEAWAINDASTVLEGNLEVTVYPSPYIGDGRYINSGYEDPYKTGFVDHERRIHFVNLPPRCTIKIYTISGDYVRRLDHPGEHSDSDSKLVWNMRSSNNELVTSGIYIFSVESEWGSQIGKLVIIL